MGFHLPEAPLAIDPSGGHSSMGQNLHVKALRALRRAEPADNGGATDAEAPGDFPLTQPILAKLLHFRHELAGCHGPPMRFPVLSCLVDSRFHAVPQNIPLELGPLIATS